MAKAELLALAQRVKRLTSPDREVDCRLHAALELRGSFVIVGPPTYNPERYFCNPSPEIAWIGYDLLNTSPRYTASLDAVIALAKKTARSDEQAVAIIATATREWAASGPDTPSPSDLCRWVLAAVLRAAAQGEG